jgi:hypothetical protein
MTRAMFGIATSLALVISPAWAEDEESVEQAAASGAVANARIEPAQIQPEASVVDDFTSTPRVDAGRDSAAMKESTEVRAAHEERWLREREGYRDGGY